MRGLAIRIRPRETWRIMTFSSKKGPCLCGLAVGTEGSRDGTRAVAYVRGSRLANGLYGGGENRG